MYLYNKYNIIHETKNAYDKHMHSNNSDDIIYVWYKYFDLF